MYYDLNIKSAGSKKMCRLRQEFLVLRTYPDLHGQLILPSFDAMHSVDLSSQYCEIVSDNSHNTPSASKKIFE